MATAIHHDLHCDFTRSRIVIFLTLEMLIVIDERTAEGRRDTARPYRSSALRTSSKTQQQNPSNVPRDHCLIPDL